MKLRLGQVADWIHAEGDFDAQVEVTGYAIDSRLVGAGELFFAVRGERDGHDFVEAALNNGAVAAVVSMRWLRPETVQESRLLRVPDTQSDCVLHSLQKLGQAVRRVWGKRVIGVTGSAGKTTTKECIAAVLAAQFNVLKTEGNFNNHLGVPLTLLRLEQEHEVAVVEMGMNHAGEIAELARIAEPDWGVVSNVGMAHTEFFADGIEGVARAKRELVEALPQGGVAVLNADDQRVRRFGEGLGVRVVRYGTAADAEVRATAVEERGLFGTEFTFEAAGTSLPVKLHLPGAHNVSNALAAFAVGLEAGVEPAAAVRAIESLRPTEKRGNVLEWRGATLINDTYNSNPTALQSMIRGLRATEAQRRILIAGEMRELGEAGAELHAECGKAAAGAGIDVVVGVRGLAHHLVEAAREAGAEAHFCETPEAAGEWMKANLRAGDAVLLKASRGVQLERALKELAG